MDERICTGIAEIDRVIKGLKPGELHVHAAAAGEMNTTFASTMTVHAGGTQRHGVMYVAIEVAKAQVWRQLCVAHSTHPKWGRSSLHYQRVASLACEPEEADFFKRVSDDLQGVVDVIEPSTSLVFNEVVPKLTRTTKLVVFDGCAYRFTPRVLKGFACKHGVAVFQITQMSRRHREAVERRRGVYEATAFSEDIYATADVLTASYCDRDLRAARTVRFSNQKNRDNPCFASFDALFAPETKRIYSRLSA